jgi:hypothetical protein
LRCNLWSIILFDYLTPHFNYTLRSWLYRMHQLTKFHWNKKLLDVFQFSLTSLYFTYQLFYLVFSQIWILLFSFLFWQLLDLFKSIEFSLSRLLCHFVKICKISVF